MTAYSTRRLRKRLRQVRGALGFITQKTPVIPPARHNANLPHAPVALPASIAQVLHHAAAAIVRVRTAEGTLLALIVIVAGLLASCLADWLIHTPQPVRILLFLLQLSAVAAVLWLRVLRPLFHKPSDREAALRLQNKFPALRCAPISAIELACGHGKSLAGARVLIERLGAETAALLRGINPSHVATPNAIPKLAKIAAVLVFLNVVWIVLLWPDSPTWLARWPGLRVPPPTQTIVRDVTTDFTARRGANVELRALAEGVIPRSGRVRLDFADGTTSEITAQPASDGNAEFSAVVTSAQIPFRYTFLLNDGEGTPHRVNVVLPPTVADFSIREIFPAYTGREPKNHVTGSLDFLVGSTLELQVKATQDLRQAEAVLAGPDQHIPLELSKNSATGKFKVPPGLTGLSFPLVNTDGSTSVDDTIFRATSVEDKPPELTVPDDTSLIESLTSGAEFDLRYSCTDDFGISAISLHYAIADSKADEAPAATEFKSIPLPIPKSGDAETTFPWKPGSLPGAAPGQTVFYFLEAADNRAPDGPGVTRTRTFSVALVTAAEKRLETLRRAGEAAREIRQLGDKQLGIHDQLLLTPQKP